MKFMKESNIPNIDLHKLIVEEQPPLFPSGGIDFKEDEKRLKETFFPDLKDEELQTELYNLAVGKCRAYISDIKQIEKELNEHIKYMNKQVEEYWQQYFIWEKRRNYFAEGSTTCKHCKFQDRKTYKDRRLKFKCSLTGRYGRGDRTEHCQNFTREEYLNTNNKL